MDKTNLTKKEILEGLSKTASVFYKRCLNKWVNVQDFSLIQELTNQGVGKVYSSAMLDVMREHGLVEMEGERSGRKYRINGNITIDAMLIAEQTWMRQREKVNQYKARRGDTTPIKVRPSTEKVNPNTKLIPKKFPQIREKVYVLYENHITEGYVSSITEEGDTGILVSVRINPAFEDGTRLNRLNEVNEPNEYPIRVCDLHLGSVFYSVEEAATYLMKKVLRYKK